MDIASEYEKLQISPLSLTVVILTFNESLHIKRAIESVAGFASDILVVDSFSKDDTCEIAETAGARVIKNPFINQSKQFQWGLDHGKVNTAWIMRLDADEVIEDDLKIRISRSLPTLPENIVGINLSRKHIFMGRWIRHGGRYPLHLLRIWRNGHGFVEDRWMDEHIVVWGGKTINIKGGFSDINNNDLSFFIDKHNKYATREAFEQLIARYNLRDRDDNLIPDKSLNQKSLKRLIKNKIYNKLPFWFGPITYFSYRYVFQLGFLDGIPGLIYHFLQGFWYRFLVGAKALEMEGHILDCRNNEERILRLKSITGFSI